MEPRSEVVVPKPNYWHFDRHGSREIEAEELRAEWSKRETRRITEADLAGIGRRTRLTPTEFRRLARFIFAEHPKLRRQALLTGQIEMGDGRVIRRVRARKA